MTGWVHIFILLLSKDVFPNDENLSMSMLSILGLRHVNDFAWEALDHGQVSHSKSSNFNMDGVSTVDFSIGEVTVYRHTS